MFGSESTNRRRSAGSSSSRDWNCSAGGEVIIIPMRYELGLMCFCFSPRTTARRHIYVKFGCFLTEENTIWRSQVTTVPYVRLSAGTLQRNKYGLSVSNIRPTHNLSYFQSKKWLTTNMTTKWQKVFNFLEMVTKSKWKSTLQPHCYFYNHLRLQSCLWMFGKVLESLNMICVHHHVYMLQRQY